jgi:quercetin dioxygenase-like cupin family protein
VAAVPQPGDEIKGADGFTLRLIGLDPEALVMEATYSGAGGFPPEHAHPGQEERFEVLEGAVKTVIEDDEGRHEAGESFDVPAGARHRMAADGPARVRWEVRPPLRTWEFFGRLHGDGPGSARAAESIADFLAEFEPEITFTGR